MPDFDNDQDDQPVLTQGVAPQPINPTQDVLSTLQQSTQLPSSPMDQLAETMRQRALQTPHDKLLELMHLTPEEDAKRGKLGKVGVRAADVLSILAGKNYTNEADKQYQLESGRIGQGIQELRNKQLQDVAAENARLKEQANTVAQNKVDVARMKAENDKILGDKKNEINEKLANAKISRAEAQNLIDQIRGSNMLDNGGMTNEYAMLYRIANGDDPETIAREIQTLKLKTGMQAASRMVREGSTMTPSLDTNNNVVRNTQTHWGFPGLNFFNQAAGALMPQGQGAPQGNPIQALQQAQAQQPAAGPNLSPVMPQGPVRPPLATPPPQAQGGTPALGGVPQVDDQFDTKKFTKPANIIRQITGNNIIATNKETQDEAKLAEQARVKMEAKRNAVAAASSQTANLSNAIANGKEGSFQGLLPSILKPIREYMTDIGSKEAQQEVADYVAKYNNLASSVKGSYRNLELSDAQKMQGATGFTPRTAMLLHLVNSYQQQEQMLDVARKFQDANGNQIISKEEINKLVDDTINDYAKQVFSMGDESKKNPLPVSKQVPAPPQLKDIINKYLVAKKLGMTGNPSPGASSGGGGGNSRSNALKDLNK